MALCGIGAFNALLILGYALSFSELLSYLRFPHNAGLLLSAAALFYLTLASAVLSLHWLLQQVRRPLEARIDPGRRRLLSAAGGAVLAAPFAVLAYGTLVERLDFRVREVEVPIPALPADLDGLRLLHLSDIHLSAFLSERDLAHVVDAAIELRPHLAAITGDLITSRGDPLDAAIRQLARLKTDAGIFGCMGNHEIYADACDHAERAGAHAGIRFLRHAAQPLRFGSAMLNLAGLDYDSKSNQAHYLWGMKRFVAPGAVNVLLQHNPDVFPIAVRQGYNLLLAGHTHGGQVTVEILDESINPARFFTPYVYGLYRSGASATYVTRGIGTIGIPARIGAPPEISLLRLRKA
jgi:uncharacterized protein